MRKNLGGWPARKKTIFDPRARREALKASDILDRAKTHLRQTAVDGELWDAVVCRGDWPTTEAMEILDAAGARVNQAEREAHRKAEARG